MNSTVRRTLILLVASTALVVAALVAGLGPQTEHATHTMTVCSEAAFIAGMIPHHQEAVESARAILETTERPEVRELAQNIIATQTEEIALLEGWFARWYPGAEAAAYEPMMPDPAGLSPDEADRAFLEGMIVHHGGAIDMAESYLTGDLAKRPEVVQLAETTVTMQDAETKQMQEWLSTWYGGPDADHGAH